MTYQETKTRQYVTRLPFWIDAALLARQDWYILQREQVFPREQEGHDGFLFRFLTLVIPVFRITYARLRGTPGITPWLPPVGSPVHPSRPPPEQ